MTTITHLHFHLRLEAQETTQPSRRGQELIVKLGHHTRQSANLNRLSMHLRAYQARYTPFLDFPTENRFHFCSPII